MPTVQPTNQEILTTVQDLGRAIQGLTQRVDDNTEAIQGLAQHMDERFDQVDQRFERVETRLDKVEIKLGKVETRLDKVETGLTRSGAVMVTKDYLDKKIGQLRGDFVLLTRKEDLKVDGVIHKLREKNVFTEDDVSELHSLEPFPRG